MLRGRIYRHYKGGYFKVLGIARRHGNDRMDVVYRHMSGEIWIRPLKEFLGYVTINGVTKRRFERLK